MSDKWEIGLDGWPVSPDHPANRDKRTIEQIKQDRFIAEIMVLERAWHDGSFYALARAVKICGERGMPLPFWTEAGVQKVIADHFHGRLPKGRGRSANPKSAHRDNMVHLERWSEVDYVRRYWRHIADPDVESGPDVENGKHFVPIRNRPTLEQAYELVSQNLHGTPSGGTADAIKKSYQLVERFHREGKGGRFWM